MRRDKGSLEKNQDAVDVHDVIQLDGCTESSSFPKLVLSMMIEEKSVSLGA